MTGRFVSLIAVPLSLIGHLLFWMGSARLLFGARVAAPVELGDVVAVSAGILLIAAAVATVVIGSLGVIVNGAVQVLFSLLLFLVPVGAGGGFSPAFELMSAVRSAGAELGDGLFFSVAAGYAFVSGTIMLAAGFIARSRRGPAPIEARLGAVLAGLLAFVGILMAVAGGAMLHTSLLVTFAGLDPLGLTVLVVGSLLACAAVLIAGWTSIAALVAGAITTVAGLAGLAAPGLVLSAAGDRPELRRGLEIAAPSGSLLLIGVLLVVAGLALRVRGKRGEIADETAPPVAPPSV